MFDSIRLSAHHPLTRNIQESCPLCGMRESVFSYDLTSGTHVAHTFQHLHGDCCLECAARLLGAMEEIAVAEKAASYCLVCTRQIQ
jgi:hypothetical protein